MNRMFVRAALLTTLMAPALAGRASAQALNFSIDPNHTQVMFRVRHLGISWVTGRFATYTGAFVFDSTNLAGSSAQLTIQTASVTTENERRDNHLRSPDFFAADSFPQITFQSTRVERGTSPGTYRITGDLTIRGITRPITLDAELTGIRVATSQRGRQALAGFLLTGRVNRFEYGLRWNNLTEGINIVGDEVRITVEVEARAPVT